MKKFAKILGIVAAVLVVLVIALVILVRVVVTPERIKAILLPKAQEALGREVALGDIDVSLFSGITLHKLAVQEKEKGTEPFIAADQVVLRYQFWPLLKRRIVVDEIRLDAPRIRVERRADGSFNFSDLPEKFKKEKKPEEEKEPVNLLVSEVAVSGGELFFVDHKVSRQGAPYRLQVTGFDFSATDISPTASFPWEMKAQVGGGVVTASGKVDPEAKTAEVKMEAKELSVTPFTPYFADKLPGRLNAMRVNLDLTAEGGKEKMSSKGTMRLAGIDLVLKKKTGGEIPIRNATAGIDYVVNADLASKNLALGESTVTFNNIPLKLSGNIQDFTGEKNVDLLTVVPELDLGPTLGALPPALLPAAVGKLNPSGKVSANLRFQGPASAGKRLLRSGEVKLGQFEANLGKGRGVVDGVLHLAGDTVTSRNLMVQMGENRASVDLKASNLFGDIIQVTSAVRADRFALDPLLKGPAAAASGKGAPSPQTKTAKKQREPLKLPLRADGTVNIGQTVYKGLAIRNFSLRYLLDKGVVTVPQMTGQMVGGTFRSQARLDLGAATPPFTISLDLQGLQADPLVTAFFPKAAGTVFGALNMNTRFEGVGIEPAAIKRTLSGRGAILVRDGKLTGAGFMAGLSNFLNLEELRVLRFSQAKGSFTAAGGKVQVDSKIDGERVRMHPSGTVALENYGVDLALNPLFSPELTRKLDSRGRVTQFLTDEQGWGKLPVKVAGTLGKPRFSLDTTAVREKVKEKAGQEIRKQLQKGLERIAPPKKEGEVPPAGGQEPGRGTVQDTLRGLLGR